MTRGWPRVMSVGGQPWRRACACGRGGQCGRPARAGRPLPATGHPGTTLGRGGRGLAAEAWGRGEGRGGGGACRPASQWAPAPGVHHSTGRVRGPARGRESLGVPHETFACGPLRRAEAPGTLGVVQCCTVATTHAVSPLARLAGDTTRSVCVSGLKSQDWSECVILPVANSVGAVCGGLPCAAAPYVATRAAGPVP